MQEAPRFTAGRLFRILHNVAGAALIGCAFAGVAFGWPAFGLHPDVVHGCGAAGGAAVAFAIGFWRAA